tara:strand:- start:181 stop:453 length:273 start_codon:yes stop_codon:yes gene_type:complete
MEGFFIDKGAKVGVCKDGFDENWIMKSESKDHTTRKDLFIELSDCNVGEYDEEDVLLANHTDDNGKVWGIAVPVCNSHVEASWIRNFNGL